MSNLIAVDFDGTVWNYSKGWNQGIIDEPPYEGCKEALKRFRDEGYRVIIYSCRTSLALYDKKSVEKNAKVMKEYLDKYEIPYDEIYCDPGKPHAALFIDDRGYRFNNWTGDEVANMLDSIKRNY